MKKRNGSDGRRDRDLVRGVIVVLCLGLLFGTLMDDLMDGMLFAVSLAILALTIGGWGKRQDGDDHHDDGQ